MYVMKDAVTIPELIKKSFSLCFKMLEGFENLDNILRE